MEFEDHEEEEEEEEMGFPVTPVAGYDSLGNSGVRTKMSGGGGGGVDGGETTTTTATAGGRKNGPTGTVRYRECQKNHAVSIGGHAVDGCCEFLAAGEEGTLEAVICAACNCHRNFHRKEIDGEITSHNQQRSSHHTQYHHNQHPHQHHQISPYYHRAALPPPPGYHHMVTPPPVSHHRPLALPPAASSGGFSREDDDVSIPSSSGGGGGGGGSGMKKRFRTKFTPEQKEKMLAFADQIGWRIQKEDEGAIEQFCAENCIKRNVLKVWMHNNKHTRGKKP
ncbi:zinc-finger homeodomain protein 2-like [Trifolium pratense]|uniref:zinc-finger homeodomain protein 2-like n=1 Tax=Trifolium pratense TaxID=57577 RepID=UPI001E68FE54|nr:zinc-finger homeodomain protein 2-like [Trifolium pratense]